MSNGTLLVATVGQAVIRSGDDGRLWHRLGVGQDLEFDAITRALSQDPEQANIIYVGTDIGLCVSHDCGGTWQQMDTPFKGQTVWKVAVDPQNRQRIFAGTGAPSRAVLWRSLDGGQTWDAAPVEIPEFCAGVSRPRLLAFAYDPTDANKIWFGLEEGGLFHSQDGGDTWQRLDDRLLWDFNSDVHAIAVLPNHGQKVVVVVCVNAVYRSFDDGQTWTGIIAKETFGLYYVRAMSAHHQSQSTVYISISDGTPGTTSKILLSKDAAATWEVLPLPQQPNSCIWAIQQNFNNPAQMVAGTKYGHLFTSKNGGNSWIKHWREFSEIADVLWTPANTEIKALHQSVIEK
ncbi:MULTISPECIES: WD40/YVTN/BNR-like repeat-containing protein [Acinetobacter]|uniref:WD40/YVTN/BNR-like repeat-containing protein n=1 Tax=Acinetobacter TaxID=469 RepID=UPI0006FDD618|nr:YCF48-related protein [Acinetobacter sp. Root1280]KQW88260.1 glycosyl hydrolase [Acinetobacter sp. Root1280]